MKTNEANEMVASNEKAVPDLQQLLAVIQCKMSPTDVLNFIAEIAQRNDDELAFSPSLSYADVRVLLLQEQQEVISNRPKKCVHCGHEHVHSKGRYKGGRRWICTKCKRTFSDFTGTIFAYIHKLSEMIKYLETDFFQGVALRVAAQRIEVDKRTTFAWRHKFAVALQRVLGKLPDEFVSVDDFVQEISLKGAHHETGREYKNPKVRVESLNGEYFINGLVSSDDGEHFNIQLVSFGGIIAENVGERFLKRCVRAKKRVVLSSLGRLAVLGRKLKRGKRRVEYSGNEGGALCEKWKDLSATRAFFKVAQDWGKKFHGVATKYQNNYYATISWIATHFREPNWFKNLLRELLTNREALRKYQNLRYLKLE